MKKIAFTLALVASPFFSHAVTRSCSDQVAELNAKVAAATRAGNSAEVSRLRYALTKVKTYCTDERQASRAREDVSDRQLNVKKAEHELLDAQQELAEAQANGRADKIAKKSRKVEEKKRKLQDARNDLSRAQDSAARLP
ncbi:DUF1090 family protein [Pantoea sp. KPR_PJ]|uniref:DUF1090 family protein n=1 Tax=Pantoea sp. KPR_PJ TaxID=2738375 RepID=UPI003527EBDA